jgi:hypothetical protein
LLILAAKVGIFVETTKKKVKKMGNMSAIRHISRLFSCQDGA